MVRTTILYNLYACDYVNYMIVLVWDYWTFDCMYIINKIWCFTFHMLLMHGCLGPNLKNRKSMIKLVKIFWTEQSKMKIKNKWNVYKLKKKLTTGKLTLCELIGWALLITSYKLIIILNRCCRMCQINLIRCYKKC